MDTDTFSLADRVRELERENSVLFEQVSSLSNECHALSLENRDFRERWRETFADELERTVAAATECLEVENARLREALLRADAIPSPVGETTNQE